MRVIQDLWAIIVILILMAVCATALYQRDTAVRSLDLCKAEVERQEIVIDCLETMDRLEADVNRALEKENLGLAEDIYKQNLAIRGYKAWGEAMEGRIRKMAGAYHIREMNLLAEIERLKECIRSGVLPPLDLNQLPPLEVDENGEVIRPKINPGFPATETDDGRHNQSETWSRVAYPESPCGVSADTGMGCGGNARERFSTRHPRLVPLQKGVRRKMGRR